MTDPRKAMDFYADPANQEPAGPPVRRLGRGKTGEATAAKRTGEYRSGTVFSVRVGSDMADELRWASGQSGRSVSDLFRQALGPVLATIRADWYETHGTDEDWEVVPGDAERGEPRSIAAQFGVRLQGEQIPEVAAAADACGVTISAFMRQAALAVAEALCAGGTARCPHMAIGAVTAAQCPDCGPLAVTMGITRVPGSPATLAGAR